MSIPLEVEPTTVNANTTKQSVPLNLWLLLAVCGLYLIQLCTPLRLTGDSIVLLSVASSAADGHGFLDHGQKTHYPPGYPSMVVCLERAGAARPWGLVGLNVLFLFVGFGCAWLVAHQYFDLSNDWALMTVSFTALSFGLIKHFTLPLTDVPFFGISMVTLLLLVRAEKECGSRYYLLWAAALMTSLLAMLVRPIAIALLPAWAWSVGERFRFANILRQNKRATLIICGLVGVFCCAVSVLLMHTKYVQEAISVLAGEGIGHGFRNILLYRVHEFGELSLNIPSSKLGKLSALVWVTGALTIVTLVFCVRHSRVGVIEVYFASYVAIMLLWPYGDTRFWIPLLPLLFAEFFSTAQPWSLTGWRKRASILYAGAYALMGFGALGYSTRITFSGGQFPYLYGDNHLRSTYELFYSDPRADRSTIDEPALNVLQRYSGNLKGRSR